MTLGLSGATNYFPQWQTRYLQKKTVFFPHCKLEHSLWIWIYCWITSWYPDFPKWELKLCLERSCIGSYKPLIHSLSLIFFQFNTLFIPSFNSEKNGELTKGKWKIFIIRQVKYKICTIIFYIQRISLWIGDGSLLELWHKHFPLTWPAISLFQIMEGKILLFLFLSNGIMVLPWNWWWNVTYTIKNNILKRFWLFRFLLFKKSVGGNVVDWQ